MSTTNGEKRPVSRQKKNGHSSPKGNGNDSSDRAAIARDVLYGSRQPAYALTPQGWLGEDNATLASSITIASPSFFGSRFEVGRRGRLSMLAARL